ncbi:hypothetical protein PMAYCL1PPCAC_00836, partial [Pristionchus mayeri]
MLVASLLVALLATGADARVTFTSSEVLDDVDLRGVNTASFGCKSGCRVYSPTRRDNIIIKDSMKKKWARCAIISSIYHSAAPAASNADYTLVNQGAADPSFLLYIVARGAANYNSKVLTILSASRVTVTDPLLTVLSSSGAIRFTSFKGDYSDVLPAVYTTGFDSIDTCRPVFNAISALSMVKTSFTVYSPIATIDFKKASGDKSVLVTGEAYASTESGEDVTSVFVSPG